MPEFSDQYVKPNTSQLQLEQDQQRQALATESVEQGAQIAQQNLDDVVQTESGRRVNQTDASQPQPASSWSHWNLARTADGQAKLAPKVEPTMAEKKEALKAKLDNEKALRLAGTSSEAQQLRAEAEAASMYGYTSALAEGSRDAVFNTTGVAGVAGNVALRALKSFTDVIDEDIISAGNINNIDQQSAAYQRQVENEAQHTTAKFQEAQQAFAQGNEIEASWKAMGALVDMGGIMGSSLWNNPGQVLDMLADSASFFVGGTGLAGKTFAAARDVSYALRAAKAGVLEYEERNGVPPTGDDLGRILAAAGATGILSRASSLVLRGDGGKILKRPANAVMNATANATKAATQKLISSVAGRRAANALIDTTRVAGAFGRDALLEGAEEVAQEYLETNVMQGTDIEADDARRLVEAGVGGAAMGGTLGVPRAAVEVAGTTKAAAKGNSALDLQDAKVRKLLAKSRKGKDSTTAEGRQSLYAEALAEQAKADEQAARVETATAQLEKRLKAVTSPATQADDDAAAAKREEYKTLQDEVTALSTEIKTATEAGADSITTADGTTLALTTANERLESMQANLEALPEPEAEPTPAELQERAILAQLTPRRRSNLITVLTDAIAKNRNSLKQYSRTKAAAEKIAAQFDITEEQRIASDAEARVKAEERKEAQRIKADFDKAKAAEAETGVKATYAFEPYKVDSASKFAPKGKATPEEEAQLKAAIGTGTHVRPEDSTTAPKWDSRKPGEDTNTAFGRLLSEYADLPEEQQADREKIVMAMFRMTDASNPEAVAAFKTPEDAVAAVEAMGGIMDHFTTGNTKNLMTAADFEAVVNAAPEENKAELAKGIYGSLASGSDARMHDFMVNATPEQLKVIGAKLTPEALDHLLSQGEIHKAIAELAKTLGTVSDEIVNTGFDAEGHTGEKMSVLQHEAAIQLALNAGDQEGAREAFVNFNSWAKEHVARRSEWIKILTSKGYDDSQADKLPMTAAERKQFPYASSTKFLETLKAEDALFRQTLASSFRALENQTGITEWWVDSLETSNADSAHIRAANSRIQDDKYDMNNMVAPPTDMEVDKDGKNLPWSKLSAGQKAHVRKKRNLLRYFGSLRKNNALINVFAKTNNLIARVLAGVNLNINQVAGIKMYGTNGYMSSEQSESWSAFMDFHGQFEESWKNSVRAGSDNRDLMSNFYASNGKDMDPNVRSILATVAYDYVATQGISTLTTSAEDMDKMFGTEYANISQADRQKMLRDIQGKGIPRTALMRELGLAATRNLGIKFEHEGAPTDVELELATALGHAMLLTLVDQGILKQSSIKKADHKGFASAIHSKEVALVAVAKMDGQLRPRQDIANMVKTYKKEGNIMKMFGGGFSKAKEVYTNVNDIPKHTRTVKGENKLSTEQNGEPGTKEAVEAMNAVPRKFKSSWLSLLENLSVSTLRALDGFKKDVGTLNIDERMNVEGKNNQIDSNLDDILEHIDFVGSDNWYVNHTIVANQRTNIEGYGDYQKNKWTRMAMQNSADGTNTIHLDNTEELNTLHSALTTYMKGDIAHRVIEGNNEPELTMQTATPEMREALVNDTITFLKESGAFDLLEKAIAGPVSDTEQAEFVRLLQVFESTFKTEPGAELLELVRGLHELHVAQESNATSFETSFSGEADGTSNGVFFTLVQMGVFENIEEAAAQLERYGLKIKGFTGTDADIAKDIYQYIGSERQAARKLAVATEADATEDEQRMADALAEAQTAMDSFIGEADSRNTNKPHTMTTIYSMAIQGQFAEIAKLLQKKVTSELSEIAKIEGEAQRNDALESLADRVNTILRVMSSDIRNYDNLTVDQIFSGLGPDSVHWSKEKVREATMKSRPANDLERYAKTVEGPHLQTALETVFGKFSEKSKSLNNIANNIFEVSEQAREMLTMDALARAEAAGDISEDERKAGKLPKKYTDEVNQKLKSDNLAAQMPSAQSTLGDYDTYLQLGDSDIALDPKSMHIQGAGVSEKRDAISGLTRERVGPGAGTGAIATHSLDALGMLKRMATGILGVHDAEVGPALELAKQSREYNKFYMSALTEYSHINAASLQLNEMLQNIEALSISLNTTASGQPSIEEMTKLYKKVLIGAYKNQKDVINGMDYFQLKNAINSYSKQLEEAVARQKAITLQIMSAATELNQMSMSDETGYKVSKAVKDMSELPDLAPQKYSELMTLDIGESAVAVRLQAVVKQEFDAAQDAIAEARSSAKKDDPLPEDKLAEMQTKRQWLADLYKELGRIFAPGHLVMELRKNGEYSVAENVNSVLESAYNNLSVLVTPEEAKGLINLIKSNTEAVVAQETAAYDDFVNVLDSEGDVEYVETELDRRAKAQEELIREAKAELNAIAAIKGSNVVPESHKTTGIMQVFADMLSDITNAQSIGAMFSADPDKSEDMSSMAKAVNKKARKGMPAHTRKAIETIAAAGSNFYIQVGGKNYVDANGELHRNQNPELATVPFIIKGNTIEIAPPSFLHSPFNNPANLTRLAAALQLDTLSRGDVDLASDASKQAVRDLSSAMGETEVPSTSVTSWFKEILRQYLTDVEFAKQFDAVGNEDAKYALGNLAKQLGVKFNVLRLGANTEIKTNEIVWKEQREEAEKEIVEAEVGSNPTGQAEGEYGSIADGKPVPAADFKEIEGASLAETVTMLGNTYGAEPDAHADHLTRLMDTMGKAINKIQMGIAVVTGKVQQGHYDNGRVTMNVFDSKDASATSKLIESGHVQGAQEIFAHEVVHAATGFALDNSPALYNEANALWQEVRDAKGTDGKPLFDYTMFMPDGMDANSGRQADVEMANFVKEKMFDHIFNIQIGPNGTSNHVAEFIAYGNTNARFRAALAEYENNVKLEAESKADTDFLSKLGSIFGKVVSFITRKSDTSDEKLLKRFDALTARLAANDAKHKGALMAAADYAANGAGKVFGAAATSVAKTMEVMGKGMAHVPVDAVSNTGKIITQIATGKAAGIMDGLDKAYDHVNKARHGWMSSLVSESLGRRKYELTTRRDIRRITAASDSMRQNIQDSIASAINSSFSKPLDTWEVQDQRDMTNIILRADMSTLAYTGNNVNSLNMDLVKELLENPSAIDSKIAVLTKDLVSIPGMTPGKQAFYVRNARALGAFMATGKVVDDLLLNNATAIALEHGTPNARNASKSVIADHRKAIAIIDQLASLNALHFSPVTSRRRVAEIAKNEPHGIAMLLSSHFANKNDSRDTQFKDAPTLMLKGYLPDATAKNVELRLAPVSDEELYTKQGWVVNSKLARDKSDHVHSDMQYYTRRTVGTVYNKGGFDLTSMAARGIAGTKISTMSPEQAKALGVQNEKAVAQRSKAVVRMYRPLGKDTLTDQDILSGKVPNRMAPTLDSQGNIAEYRYLVPNTIKDSVLMREVNPATVMAKAHGQTKQRAGLVSNTTPLVSTLKLVYDNLPESKKDTVVEISAHSTDRRGLEAYRMLPQYIKNEIRDKWGMDKMYVPAAMMDPVFGNRSLSVESWLRDPQVAKGFADVTHKTLQTVFGPNVAYGAGYIQETIQTLVGQAKKAIIVKSAAVLQANVISNTALLVGMGVSPSDAIHHYKEAIPETRRYQRDTEEAFAIDMKISAMSHGERFKSGAKLQQRRAQLMDSLARNPMHELMEAGAYVNIATQMGVSTSQIQDDPTWIEKIKNARQDYLSETVNKVIDEVALTEDSKLYKTAVVGAQMTDFAARYALVRHLTTKGVKSAENGKTKRYTHKEAIDMAMDVFVDFAGATSPELQLANDFGFVMFSKYRLRVANALMAAGDINPKGAHGLAIMDMALNAADVTAGITAATGSMGLTGLASSITTPMDTISHIADNTLVSYAKRLID